MPTITGALRLVASHRRQAALQLVAYPLLAMLWAVWLWIPDAHWYQLILTIVLAIAIALGFVHGNASTMRAYREDDAHTTVSRSLSLLLWLAIFCALLWWIASWSEWFNNLGPYLYSKLSHSTRQSIRQPRLTGFLTGLRSALFWYFIPALLLPLGVEWASHAVHRAHYRAYLRSVGNLWYWIALIPLALIAAWIPDLLVSARFGASLSAQTFSVIVRVGLAYLVTLACWLLALALAAQCLRESDTHLVRDNTVGEPAPQPA